MLGDTIVTKGKLVVNQTSLKQVLTIDYSFCSQEVTHWEMGLNTYPGK